MTYQANIDWARNDFGNVAEVKCLAYIVDPTHVPPVVRENTSAHDCVVKAVREYRAGNQTIAHNWLLATQCHSDVARTEIDRAGFAAIKYTVDKYGGNVS